MATQDIVFEYLFPGASQGHGRFTQDLPILPDVWLEIANLVKQDGEAGSPDHFASMQLELLLTPHNRTSAYALGEQLASMLKSVKIDLNCSKTPSILVAESHVLVRCGPHELALFLPMTTWLQKAAKGRPADSANRLLKNGYTSTGILRQAQKSLIDQLKKSQILLNSEGLVTLMREWDDKTERDRSPRYIAEGQLFKMLLMNAWLLTESRFEHDDSRDRRLSWIKALELMTLPPNNWDQLSSKQRDIPTIWSITLNRRATMAVRQSRAAVKADAVEQLFGVNCKNIRWAIVDSGIDARHPGFASDIFNSESNSKMKSDTSAIKLQQSRVVATYDFSRIRRIWTGQLSSQDIKCLSNVLGLPVNKVSNQIRKQTSSLQEGSQIDWEIMAPLLSVPHDDSYFAPDDGHGTHVAGILGSAWQPSQYATGCAPPDLDDGAIFGICPGIEIVDIRVFPPRHDISDTKGAALLEADEFSLIAALQFVRWLNRGRSKIHIHGANLSFSLAHDVRNYACGRTPICEEAERLWRSGVVVVAAAGNRGFEGTQDGRNLSYSYLPVSITDPGNCEKIITVGSTHRLMPHTYGVSYFSSRGPTGDGRSKPDIVAPGEKINSLGLNLGSRIQDGTSMAAPHVSGVAALLMSRHTELMGNPDKVKEILCKTATCLGRTRDFQGAGLVDALRALQQV